MKAKSRKEAVRKSRRRYLLRTGGIPVRKRPEVEEASEWSAEHLRDPDADGDREMASMENPFEAVGRS